MANNRMYLVNKRLGLEVRLGTYFPSKGWYIVPGIDQRLADSFLGDDIHTMYGNEDWELSFEQGKEAEVTP